MFQISTINERLRLALGAGLCAFAICTANNVLAQANPVVADTRLFSLEQAFSAAWLRQPEAQSLDQLRDVASARQKIAANWLVAPPTMELSGKSDQWAKNQGSREYVAGLALPLWLPGERQRAGAWAEAAASAVNSRAYAAQLRISAAVRDAWWNWRRAHGEQRLASERLDNARRLAADVARRVRAGDLARADQHQAEGAAASAEFILAESTSVMATATQNLRALTGLMPSAESDDGVEPPPAVPADFATLDASHPAVRELFDRAEVARRAAELATVQTRNNPELVLMTTRDRGLAGEEWQQNVTLGVRLPFGSEERNRAKAGAARAEAIETEGLLRLERERLASDLEAARLRVESAHLRQQAADKRAELARESRAFFEKSFRLGETDLPTRLRIELEAMEAERQSARARLDLAAAISTLRQAMGLLPELK